MDAYACYVPLGTQVASRVQQPGPSFRSQYALGTVDTVTITITARFTSYTTANSIGATEVVLSGIT
eukprot:m.177871 g.177871  ORF g.177871 m.177871 type:complete len:66 (-) comp15461_c0_seq2:194-391(-)